MLVAALTTAVLSGQTFQGQISGVVHDKSGAVVPRVQLSAVDVNSGAKYTTLSNEAGIYRFAALPPSQYKLLATLQGFKAFSEGPITIQVNQNYDLDITLEPGEVSETVQVTSEAPPLETASATLGQVVTTRSIMSLPLNVRDTFALVGLTPGVTFGSNFGNGRQGCRPEFLQVRFQRRRRPFRLAGDSARRRSEHYARYQSRHHQSAGGLGAGIQGASQQL